MRAIKFVLLSVFWGVFSFPFLSVAAEFDDEEEEKPWKEAEVGLPDFTSDENLIPFQVGVRFDTGFFIDGNSVSVGSDGVIRFTLIVHSSAGARNISYEGVRCDTGERRFYAAGRLDKTWAKARGKRWIKINGGWNNHYAELYANYFCTVGAATLMDAESVRAVLRKGGNPRESGP